MIDLFIPNMQLYTLLDINWWTGVVWIIVMFLSAAHSDGTHPLKRIHWWASDVMLNFSKSVLMKKQTTSWMAWEWVNIHFLDELFL